MKKTTATEPRRPSVLKAFLLTLPMMALTFVMLTGEKRPSGGPEFLAFAVTYCFLNLTFFLMLRTGKTDRWRAPVFVAYAVAFVISFISHLVAARGSMALTEANILRAQAPFCHIVIPMTLIPGLLNRTIIFPGTMIGAFASVSSMLVLWIGASLSLGRGFCSWACFFGGLEDGFSRIFRRPLIRRISPALRYLPWAVLLSIVLLSAAALSPVYCNWLCPFKTVTEYVQVTSLKTLIQMVIFVTLFAGLVVVLPVLTKKRTQCGLFCPFGAFQTLTNKVSAVDIRIAPDRCITCGKCVRACPTLSLDDASIAAGKTLASCTKCGKCIDACPKGAITYHVKGTAPGTRGGLQRALFLYPAFLFLATMSGGFLRDAIAKIVNLVATGHFI
jgi:ferredoxin/heme/copper-type cytochrome/quinol oxidase subunit 4